MSKSLSRMTALFVGLLFSVGALFGFAGTAFADDDVPAELDPNTASSQQALLKPCPPLVLPTVTVTVFLPDNEPGACENPQAETFETCLALLATYFGQTLTREQAAQCLPAIPEGFDAGTDPIAESGVQTPPNHDEGRIELTGSDACAAPPSGRPGVHAPTIDLFKVKIKFGSGSEVDLEIGPASLRHLGEQLEELKKPSEYQPGTVKQQPIDAAAMARATAAAAAAAAAASAEAARQAAAAAAAEALRWKPEDIEWVRQHPASEPGDWVEPSGDTAYATPVDPLTDQQPVDHLPCEIARVACAAVGQQLAPRCANTRSSRHSRTDSATAPPSTRSTGPRARPNLSRPRTTNSRRESNGRCFSALPSRRPSKGKIHVTRTAGRTGRNSPRRSLPRRPSADRWSM